MSSAGGAAAAGGGKIWLQQLERNGKGFLNRTEKGWFYIAGGELRRTKPGSKVVDLAKDKVVCKLYLSAFKDDGPHEKTFRIVMHTGKDMQFTAATPQLYREWKQHLVAGRPPAHLELADARQIRGAPIQTARRQPDVRGLRQGGP